MSMKQPAHPGLVIRNELEELGISISDAARSLGISRQQLHAIVAGRSAVTPEMAVRLEAGIGSTADTWLRLQAAHDLARLRESGVARGIDRLTAKVA